MKVHSVVTSPWLSSAPVPRPTAQAQSAAVGDRVTFGCTPSAVAPPPATAAAADPVPSAARRAATCAFAVASLVAVAVPVLAQAAAPVVVTVSQPRATAEAPRADSLDPLPYARGRVEIVRGDSAARQKAISMVESASTPITFQSSTFRGADAARLTQALTRAAARTEVSVAVADADPALLARLAGGGVRVSDLRHPAQGSSLMVDGRGSLSGTCAWRDADGASTSAYVEGTPVQDLGSVSASSTVAPNAWVRVLRNDAARQETREALLAHIRGARTSIFIEAHGLDDPEITAALRTARDEGVSVNVLLNHTTGHFAKGANNLRSAVAFTEPNHQVPFRWYDGGDLTSMTAVFDTQTVLVAQGDWTSRGTRGDARDLLVQDRQMAFDMKFQLMMDWQEHGTFDLVRPPEVR